MIFGSGAARPLHRTLEHGRIDTGMAKDIAESCGSAGINSGPGCAFTAAGSAFAVTSAGAIPVRSSPAEPSAEGVAPPRLSAPRKARLYPWVLDHVCAHKRGLKTVLSRCNISDGNRL